MFALIYIFAIGDDEYVEVCAKFNNTQMGFCKKIFVFTHDKYDFTILYRYTAICLLDAAMKCSSSK